MSYLTAPTVTYVSLGPGNPELLTLKALKALQKADHIHVPVQLRPNQPDYSLAQTFLKPLNLRAEMHTIPLTMTSERSFNHKSYAEAAVAMATQARQGAAVVMASMGDFSIYSSSAYLLEQLTAQGLTSQIIPGIPSFALAASEGQWPLALGRERVAIISSCASCEELRGLLQQFDTLILLKMWRSLAKLAPVLTQKGLTLLYAEHVGHDTQFISTDIHEVLARPDRYFSLLMVKRTHSETPLS